MKKISAVIMLLFLISCSAKEKETITNDKVPMLFYTQKNAYKIPFGIIEKEYNKNKVKQILGNPHHVSARNKTDIWYYFFNDDKKLFVYFINDKVIDVRNRLNVEL